VDLNIYGRDPVCHHKLNNFDWYGYTTFYKDHEKTCFWANQGNKYYAFKDVTEYSFSCQAKGIMIDYCYMGSKCSKDYYRQIKEEQKYWKTNDQPEIQNTTDSTINFTPRGYKTKDGYYIRKTKMFGADKDLVKEIKQYPATFDKVISSSLWQL